MRGALPFGVESLIPPDSQTPLGLFIAAISGVFTTMGAGFLYLTGQVGTVRRRTEAQASEMHEQVDNSIDVLAERINAHALEDGRRFAEKPDLAAMEARIDTRFDRLEERINQMLDRVLR